MPLNANPAPQLVPTAVKQQLPTNYIDLFDFSTQFAPEVANEMVDIYGSQSITGMLQMLGSEEAFASDKYIWTEKGRLHTVYKDVARAGAVFTKAGHNFRLNEKVHISDTATKLIGIITAVDDAAGTFTVSPYKQSGFGTLGTTNLTVFVFGSEFRKGTNGMQGSLETDFTILSNSPVILKDKYEVSGSEAAQIGWVKTSSGGFLWYLESAQDTRRRWEDRLELSMLLGEKAEDGSAAQAAGYKGTEGAFQSVKTRGNLFDGTASALTDWDTILKQFDAQGKIDGYMLHCDRDFSLDVDNLLGTLNAGYSGGVSYGIFDNEEDMAVNLGFRSFRRGSYDFHKTDWKLLNDPTLLGAVDAAAGKVRGLLVPVGTQEVYEGSGTDGAKMAKPYLTTMYRASETENRKYKTWVTGSVGGVHTNDSDKMEIHELSERGLRLCGANNFMLFEGA